MAPFFPFFPSRASPFTFSTTGFPDTQASHSSAETQRRSRQVKVCALGGLRPTLHPTASAERTR